MAHLRDNAGTGAVSRAGVGRESGPVAERLTSSPEYLIRRAHQVAVASFSLACSDLGVTPAQYTAMFMLRGHARVGQNELGRLVALDRSTTSMVVRSLRDRGWVRVDEDVNDRRRTLLELTDAGRLVLSEAEQRSNKAGQQLLSVFDKHQSDLFMAMLRQIIAAAEVGDGLR
jgi:DNA-binding MarR family transcriptional regulator